MKKKREEMTFREFWEEEAKKKTDREALEKDKRVALEILRSQGFSDEEINEMRMEKASKICWRVLLEELERRTEAIEQSIPKLLKNGMAASSSLAALWKDPEKRKLLVTDRGLRKDLFELAGSMDDLEKASFDIEETARQLLEELKKKREEKRRKENSS